MKITRISSSKPCAAPAGVAVAVKQAFQGADRYHGFTRAESAEAATKNVRTSGLGESELGKLAHDFIAAVASSSPARIDSVMKAIAKRQQYNPFNLEVHRTIKQISPDLTGFRIKRQ